MTSVKLNMLVGGALQISIWDVTAENRQDSTFWQVLFKYFINCLTTGALTSNMAGNVS